MIEFVKTHKTWVIVASLVVVGVALYYFSAKSKPEDKTQTDTEPQAGGGTTGVTPTDYAITQKDAQVYTNAAGKKLGAVIFPKGTKVPVYRQANGYIKVECCEDVWLKNEDVK